jgi:hypothetical protein
MVATTEPQRSPSSRPTRRALLAGAAAVVPTAALPAVAICDPIADAAETDPHLAWYVEWRALLDWCNGPGPGDRDIDQFPQYHRGLELEGLIHGTPARTLAGVLVQLRVLDHWLGQSSSMNERDSAGLANALATLERLAGSAVA